MTSEDTVRAMVEVGAVLYYQSDKLVGTSKPHYYVVLAQDDDQAILLACASTQIEKRMRHAESHSISPDTLVIVEPGGESFLSERSVFDCNFIHIESLHSLARIHGRRPIQRRGTASAFLVQRLIRGVLKSPQIVKKYQDALRASSHNT